MPLTAQIRNDQAIDLSSADFQRRYEPNFAWGNVVSMFSMIPALRAFWPCSAHLPAAGQMGDRIADIACNFHLEKVNDPKHGYGSVGLDAFVHFDGVNQYAYYPNVPQFDILGNEADILYPGLTLGGWVDIDNYPTAQAPLLTKWQTANQLSYYLSNAFATNFWTFGISAGGAAVSSLISSTITSLLTWHFVVGRFVPGVTVDIYVDGVKFSAATVDATIFQGTSNLEMARFTGNNYLHGLTSLCFVSASALSDTIINALYQQSRALFGR